MQNEKNFYLFKGPVTAIAIIILVAGNIFFYLHGARANEGCLLALAESLHTPPPVPPKAEEADTAEAAFATDDRAVFEFTKDTVLVLAPAHPIHAQPAWNVLYKDHSGFYATEDLPEDMLDKIDTGNAKSTIRPKVARDKLSQYK
jgi:hypothetical protein